MAEIERRLRYKGLVYDWHGRLVSGAAVKKGGLNKEPATINVEGDGLVPATWTLLPDDIPAKTKLEQNGIQYIEQLPEDEAAYEDFTGIGQKLAARIYQWVQHYKNS